MERKHPLAECENCPLYKEGSAPTTGPSDAKVALVSRSPGKWDAEAGVPFSGPSGKVLDYLLKQNGLKREEIITTNLVLCQSDDPPPKAVTACHKRVLSEVANADTIIAAGSEASRFFTASTIENARGYVHDRNGQRIIVTNNPALVLRDADSFPNLVKDFKRAINPTPPPVFPKVTIIREVGKARTILTDLLKNPPPVLAADIEARGGTTHRAELACIGFSATGERSLVFGIETIADPQCFEQLQRLLEGPTRFVWHFGKYDVKALKFNGIDARLDEDSFVLSLACDERPGYHSLDYLLMEEFGWPYYEPSSVTYFKKHGYVPEGANINELFEYNGWDAAGTMQLFNLLRPRAEADNVYDLYKGHMLPIYQAFVDVEMRGFHFDVEEAANLREEHMIPRLWELEHELQKITEHIGYNPRSPQQSQAIIYGEWGLQHKLGTLQKKDKSTSTDHLVRTEIIEGRFKCHPGKKDKLVKWAETMEIYSKINKQKGTYVEGLIRKTLDDGKVYTSFKFGAVTGRTSSETPNIQNITRSGHYGIPSMRTLFKPSPGNVIVQADYSQAELRSIAVFSGDPELTAIYMDSSRSLHKERAIAFYGENYTKDEYTQAKNMNFGISYDQGAKAFSGMYGVPFDVAQEYIDAWWKDFPTIKKWVESVHIEVVKTGVVVNPFGRKRRFQLITRENKADVQREALNFLPQSTASEFTLASVVELNASGVPIVATVHDSIVADVPERDAIDVGIQMKRVMEAMPKKKIGWELPITVDVSIGPNWGAVEEVELEVAA
jgi:uracil-DNA glycosylase family 4